MIRKNLMSVEGCASTNEVYVGMFAYFLSFPVPKCMFK